MANNRRKSAAIALAVIGIAGLSLASASTLTINSGSIAAGTVSVTGCDDAVDVDYTFGLNGMDYEVTDVVVSDIATACDGAAIGLALNIDGTTVEYTGTADASGSWAATSDATFATFLAEADVTDVAVYLAD